MDKHGEDGTLPEQESDNEDGRLFVRNLPFSATEEDLSEYFSPFGVLNDVHIVRDRITRKSVGFGYVSMR